MDKIDVIGIAKIIHFFVTLQNYKNDFFRILKNNFEILKFELKIGVSQILKYYDAI